MFGFGIDANGAFPVFINRREQLQNFFKTGHGKLPVAFCAAQLRQSFFRAQGFQLGQREIFGEPADMLLPVDGFFRPPRGKFCPLRNIGGGGNIIFMPRDQNAILGHYQIGFDKIRAGVNCRLISRQRMFGPFPRKPAVGNDKRPIGHRMCLRRRGARRAGSSGE